MYISIKGERKTTLKSNETKMAQYKEDISLPGSRNRQNWIFYCSSEFNIETDQ
jgi:hypothetical protein